MSQKTKTIPCEFLDMG